MMKGAMMFERSKDKNEGVVPDDLRPEFEKTVLEPLRRATQETRIAERARLSQLQEELQAKLPGLQSQEERENAQLAEDEAAVIGAQEKAKATRIRRDHAHWSAVELRGQIEQLEQRKARLASPLIDDFCREMQKRWDGLRNAISMEFREPPPVVVTRGLKPLANSVVSNVGAVTGAVDYIRDAMREAEQMKNEAISDEKVESRLKVLAEGIPDHRIFERIEIPRPEFVEKSYERYGGNEFFHRFD